MIYVPYKFINSKGETMFTPTELKEQFRVIDELVDSGWVGSGDHIVQGPLEVTITCKILKK